MNKPSTRSSNIPLRCVPDNSAMTSSITTFFPSSVAGTHPSSIISARRYPIDVFPHPGFPTRMTLFFLLLDNTVIMLLRIDSLPTSLSYFPFAISSCRSMVYLLMNGVFPFCTKTLELTSLLSGILPLSWWLLFIYDLSDFFTFDVFCSVLDVSKSRQLLHMLS